MAVGGTVRQTDFGEGPLISPKSKPSTLAFEQGRFTLEPVLLTGEVSIR